MEYRRQKETPDSGRVSPSRRGEKPLLGAHMSIAGGTPRAIERATSVGCTALQIFVKNNNRWMGKQLVEEEVVEFRSKRLLSGLRSVVAHACYLINLASPDTFLWERSIAAFVEELSRCRRLGIEYLVTHPGSHMGQGEALGVDRVAVALDRIYEQFGGDSVSVALEMTAGQGTALGHRFEHMRDILAACGSPERVAVCIDTCHLFAAGYDFRDQQSYLSLIEEFDRKVGLAKLRVLHLNDSRRELGSRVDRHAHIGQGHIGLEGFRWIMTDPRLAAVPKILETPKEKDLKEDRMNLRTLRRLARQAPGG